MDPIIKKKLETKFGKVRTGGKGSIRRKNLKKTNSVKSTHLTQEEKEYQKLINKINNMIEVINIQEEQELWTPYLVEYMRDFILTCKKKYIHSNSIFFKINDNNEDLIKVWIDFITKDTDGILLLKQCYSDIHLNLTKLGYEYLLDFLYDIPNILDKKLYLPDEPVDNIDVNYLLKLLKLDTSEVPTKEELRKSYFKMSSKFHPDKHIHETEKYTKLFSDINFAYHSLLKFYYKT